MDESISAQRTPAWLPHIVLAVVTLAVYLQVGDFEFITLDDHAYVVENPNVNTGLTLKNIHWAFTQSHVANWHPLTWISHMVDVEVFGLERPGAHHLVNVLLHVINTMLMLSLWYAMTGDRWRSALVAALFALHPMHVESVAWIAERKDVLSTMFGLAAMRVYVAYTKQSNWQRYAALMLLFTLSLLAKPLFVTLPCALLLLDYWPLRRAMSPRKLVVEKLPLFALAVACSVITMFAQTTGGAVHTLEKRDLATRLAHSMVAYGGYLRRLVWPRDLNVYYLMPKSLPMFETIGAAALLAAITYFAVKRRRSRPHLLVGWLWFLGTLVPMIGIVAIGGHHIADRYSYIPATGLFVMLAWSIRGRVAASRPTHAIIAIGLVICTALAFRQVSHWRNTFTLFGHALAIDETNYRAHLNMGIGYIYADQLDQAHCHLTRSAQLAPHATRPLRLLAVIHTRRNEHDRAIDLMVQAVKLAPNHGNYRRNLIGLLQLQGKAEPAVEQYEALIRIGKATAYDHNSYGELLGEARRFDEAIEQFEAALRLDPDNKHIRLNLQKARQLQRMRSGP